MHVYIHTCTFTYICIHAYSLAPVTPLELQGDIEGWSKQTQHKVFSHKVFDLFTCNSEKQINIDGWLDILPSQAFIIILFRCSFQVHSTYKCLICVDNEAHCMCFWVITLSLHIAVLRTSHYTYWHSLREH